jgi:hypothetical protein
MIDQITTAHTALKKSRFLSRFKLTEKDLQYIQTKGIDTIRSRASDFITTRLAPAFPNNDGKQTPMRGIRFSLPSMRPLPAAGDVCGNGIGVKKVARGGMRICDGVGDVVDKCQDPME